VNNISVNNSEQIENEFQSPPTQRWLVRTFDVDLRYVLIPTSFDICAGEIAVTRIPTRPLSMSHVISSYTVKLRITGGWSIRVGDGQMASEAAELTVLRGVVARPSLHSTHRAYIDFFILPSHSLSDSPRQSLFSHASNWSAVTKVESQINHATEVHRTHRLKTLRIILGWRSRRLGLLKYSWLERKPGIFCTIAESQKCGSIMHCLMYW